MYMFSKILKLSFFINNCLLSAADSLDGGFDLASSDDTLVAIMGGEGTVGTTYLQFNPDDSFLFILDVSGLEMCSGCKARIMEGDSCVSNELGGNFYASNESVNSTDPWNKDDAVYNVKYVNGMTKDAFLVNNGYNLEQNNGHAVVLYGSDNTTIVSCGVLERDSLTNILVADLGVYPGYSGDLAVYGHVSAEFNNEGSFKFHYHLHGLEPNCTNCGVHIHKGTSCDTHELVLGHEWQDVDVQDLWTTAGGAVYNSDEKGHAEGWFQMYNGFHYYENKNHAVVVHGQDGTRLACGVLF